MEAHEVVKGRLKDEAREAKRTTLSQFIGITWSFIAMGAHSLTYLSASVTGVAYSSRPVLLLGLAYTVSNLITGFVLSGVITGSFFGEVSRQRVELARIRRRKRTRRTWRKSSSSAWHAMLETLADRAFTLEALLDFYKGLGTDFMLHFDSSRHSTADVTRGAIIPLSSETGHAYATLMMGGKPTRPAKFVTHSWGNLFRSLVAAICADALGESEYVLIEYLLDHDIELLEEWILDLGKMSTTYWVCCFSVNQHTAICGTVPPHRKDPVTGLAHQPCKCSYAKFFNDTHPLYKDKSIHCELNKFDDMLAFLGATSKLEQVVAVDADFRLFTRAWCVAELAVGNSMGIPQHMKVHSHTMLDKNRGWLSKLRIEDMYATRLEDKTEILSKIEDKERFNRKLRKLVTVRLFPRWSSLNRTAQMCRAGSVARWYRATNTPKLEGIWRATAVETSCGA